jgi:hypothetical protein
MEPDRRKAQRVRVNLPARWEGVLERHEATVTSLSFSGCFLLSGGEVQPKELLRLEIYFPDQEPLYGWAEVVEKASDIGFAVRFTLIENQDQARLAAFILRCA